MRGIHKAGRLRIGVGQINFDVTTLLGDFCSDANIGAAMTVLNELKPGLGYLNITDLGVALLLNFKESTLTWKRVVRERKDLTADYSDDADKQQKKHP